MNTEQCQYILTKGINLGLKCTIKKIFCNGLCKKHSKTKTEQNEYYQNNKTKIRQRQKNNYDLNKELIQKRMMIHHQ